MNESGVVEAQIGRPPRSSIDVAARCHLGLPVVTTVPPLLDDGTPFPTLFWLTCPLAVKRIGRIEAAGGVRAAEIMLTEDDTLRSLYERAMDRYREDRDARLPEGHTGPRPRGGVGGTGAGIKCLHAHFADTAAGNENPIGAWVSDQIEPLDCTQPCVFQIDGRWTRNPGWSEPR
jgi:hypothetical protein